jgi:hypothetical protein
MTTTSRKTVDLSGFQSRDIEFHGLVVEYMESHGNIIFNRILKEMTEDFYNLPAGTLTARGARFGHYTSRLKDISICWGHPILPIGQNWFRDPDEHYTFKWGWSVLSRVVPEIARVGNVFIMKRPIRMKHLQALYPAISRIAVQMNSALENIIQQYAQLTRLSIEDAEAQLRQFTLEEDAAEDDS